ncbi:MAG: hypothetical protein R3C28_26460 [Pirellulaceae bacterium]
MQNEFGTKFISNNIVFNNFSHGVQVYGSSTDPLIGISFDGNTFFNAGAAAGQGYEASRNVLIGGNSPAENITFSRNNTYQDDYSVPHDFAPGIVTVGYTYSPNESITLRDNYLVGKLRFRSAWHQMTVSGNTVVGTVDTLDSGTIPSSGITTVSNPTGQNLFLRPNSYEPGRAHLTVYNWDQSSTVSVDLSSVLTVGSNYEIHHVYDLNGAPIISGTFNGSAIDIPMQTMTAPALLGGTSPVGGMSIGSPVTLGREFGVFLITTTSPSSQQLVAELPATNQSDDMLETASPESIDFLFQIAADNWRSHGLTATQLQTLDHVEWEIQDLPGLVLGEANGQRIALDTNASGFGWFIDSTPRQNDEFLVDGSTLVARPGTDATGRMDLLSVITHELGHVLGFQHNDHDSDRVMAESLAPGVRKELDPQCFDLVFQGDATD